MKLSEKRILFTKYLAQLILHAFDIGYECYLGDVNARDGHKPNSFHYSGLAADLNLFKDGKYLQLTEDHKVLGDCWKKLNSQCVWGGDFKNKDGNHYQFGK